MQPQVVADRRAADPRAQQQRRRLERAAGDDDLRGAHGDPGACGRSPGRRRCASTPAARPFSTSTRSARQRTTMSAPRVDGVLQVGLLRARCLEPRLVAEADVAGADRVVARPGRRCATIVSKDQPSRSAPSFIRCCGPFRSEQRVVGADALQDRVEVAVVLGRRRRPRARARAPTARAPTAGCAGSWSS